MNSSPLDDFDFNDSIPNNVISENQSYDRYFVLYCFGFLLERITYYGIRALVVLYITGTAFSLPQQEALIIYGSLALGILISSTIGGLLGDSKLGNKRTTLLGSFLQVIGSFALCYPAIEAVYAGLSFIAIGSGLYTINLKALYGKNYLDRIKLLDSGLTMFYLVINIGAFIGTAGLAYIGEKYGYNYAFILTGISMIIAMVIIYFIKDESSFKIKQYTTQQKPNNSKIVVAILFSVLFWASMDISNFNVIDLKNNFGELLSKFLFLSYEFFLLIPFGLIAFLVWTYRYSVQVKKLTVGFVLATIYLGLLWLISSFFTSEYLILFLAAMMLYTLAGIFISPVIDSTIIQYANPKFLTITLALSLLPNFLFTYFVFDKLDVTVADFPVKAVLGAFIIMAVCSIILWVWHFERK